MGDDLYIGGATGSDPVAAVHFDSADLTTPWRDRGHDGIGQDRVAIEAELADQLAEIDARWQRIAAQVEEVSVGLERDDVDVTLVWIRRDGAGAVS